MFLVLEDWKSLLLLHFVIITTFTMGVSGVWVSFKYNLCLVVVSLLAC